LDKALDRRKVPAPIVPPVRESAGAHATSITARIDAAATEQKAKITKGVLQGCPETSNGKAAS